MDNRCAEITADSCVLADHLTVDGKPMCDIQDAELKDGKPVCLDLTNKEKKSTGIPIPVNAIPKIKLILEDNMKFYRSEKF